ncbi:NAD-dependent epimerase/dehydratase family protein [Candidatus Poribacteria bacterium]|nr:NAD-dependent epimerase/dehydratase family protein [Candidatus Poribacteria bacterium]
MKYLVTGAAGFIGSHIAQRLLDRGDKVIGIDCFLDYYPRALKEYRLKSLLKYNKLEFIEGNLLKADLSKILKDVDFVIHEAAQPGVRTGWNSDFEGYSRNNIEATQRLLNMSRDTGIRKFIFASSSSVYGNAEEMPTTENASTKPLSPYGVTKLACEHLCNVYYKSFGVPVIILRHFTVFGPKPRPDMAHTIFSRAILTGREIQIYGDGEQSRGFTYVSDIVDATMSAIEKDIKGEIFNIGGGVTATVKEIIEILEKIIGKKAITRHVPALKGEARHTYPDISKAAEMLDYHPKVGLEEGLIEVVKSVKDFYGI